MITRFVGTIQASLSRVAEHRAQTNLLYATGRVQEVRGVVMVASTCRAGGMPTVPASIARCDPTYTKSDYFGERCQPGMTSER